MGREPLRRIRGAGSQCPGRFSRGPLAQRRDGEHLDQGMDVDRVRVTGYPVIVPVTTTLNLSFEHVHTGAGPAR